MAFSAYSYLKKGDSGNSVRELQNDLIKLGFKLTKYGTDGSYGGETEQAVRNFQYTYGLYVTGIVDQATANSIKSNIVSMDITGMIPLVAPTVPTYSPTSIKYPSTIPITDETLVTDEAAQWTKDWVEQEYVPLESPLPWIEEWVKQYVPGGGVSIDWKWIGLGFLGVFAILSLTSSKRRK